MANNKVTIAASAARTTSSDSGALQNANGAKGILITLDITAASGTTPTLDVTVQRYDATSAKYVDLPGAAFAQKTGTGTDDLVIYPGIGETANRSVSDVLGEDYKVVWTIGGTTPSFTFTLGAQYIP